MEPNSSLSKSNENNISVPLVTTPRMGTSDGNLICFGTLLRVNLPAAQRAKSKIEVPKLGAKTFRISQTLYLVCYAEIVQGRCRIVSQNLEIGVLEESMFQVLRSLKRFGHVEFECILVVSEDGGLLIRDFAENSTIDITLYGNDRIADDIGEALADSNLFLQDPDWHRDTSAYRNPQLFELPEVFYTEDEQKATLHLMNEFPDQPIKKVDESSLSTEKLPEIIDQFAAHNDLFQADADQRVKTPLLVHQKTALTFMLSREAGVGPPSLMLWEKISEDHESPLYQHRITGARSPAIREAHGGILADDMGLGKSLSVLSVVAGTLNEAMQHAQLVNQMTPEECNRGPLPTKSTLILVPSTLLMLSWREELRRHIHNRALGLFEYHGSNRKVKDFDLFVKYDLILTTYATLAAEFRRKTSRLHKIHWYRVVLDEAHVIRNSNTRQYKAVAALSTRHRWCLTGTPIQNGLDDLSSLIRFLRLPLLEIPVQFRRHIASKIEGKASGENPDYENLRILLEAICLRRNKSVLDVPPSEETRRELELSQEEAKSYLTLKVQCKEAMLMATAGHRSKKVHQTVLHALVRLRIFCNNASYFGRPEAVPLTSMEEIESLLQQGSDEVINCYYCANDLMITSWVEDEVGQVTGCQQFICKDCLPEHKHDAKTQGKCPICKKQHDLFLRFNNGSQEGSGPFPSKLLDLVDQIKRFRARGPSGKGIIFSFWKKSLDIVEVLMRREGIPFLRVDGSLNTKVRSQVLHDFEHGQGNLILLMTFSTGAVGLNNLSVATHVHILEPQWNPSVESQAIGRLVRLGQQHSVQVVRYLMKDTVEIVSENLALALTRQSANLLAQQVQRRQIGKIALARDGFDADTTTWMNEVLKDV